MTNRFVILTDSQNGLAETKAAMSLFPGYVNVGTASDWESGIDLVLESNPDIIFLEISSDNSGYTLYFISELHRFIREIPKIIVLHSSAELALQAVKYGVFDYLVTPFRSFEIRRTLMRYEMSVVTHNASESIPNEQLPTVPETQLTEKQPVKDDRAMIICVKSYGDYRFIDADTIKYLQADNNSTDIYLRNGEMITAFKTLKHFESSLPSPFVRIHNSYIINADLISRIHTGTATCYLQSDKIPFSKSYKENIDMILTRLSGGNYLEV